MCIRDSRVTEREEDILRDCRRVVESFHDHRRFAMRRVVIAPCSPFSAVSYTHLRAHETVLDLVCRLLLEKKQHQYNNTHEQLYIYIYQSLTPRITVIQ